MYLQRKKHEQQARMGAYVAKQRRNTEHILLHR